MTPTDLLQYLTQVICERMKDKKEPMFPVVEELYVFIQKYEQVSMEELRKNLNALYKESKLKVRETVNSKLIELI